jgi:hypothetical protein
MNKVDWAIIIFFVILAGFFRLLFFNGLYGHDDWVYLFYIRSFLNDQTQELLHSLWGLRFLIWYPVVLFFKLFGVSYWGTFFTSFIMGLATFPLTYYCVLQLQMPRIVASLACLLLLLNPIDWMVSSTIRGDIEMSFYGGLILLLILLFRKAQKGSRYVLGLGTGIIWGLSVLTKEWGYLFAWGFFALALYDTFRSRRIPWSYITVLLGFIFVLCIDNYLLHLWTGDWFARVKTSLSWYRTVALEGGYINDLSTSYVYLPSLLAGIKNELTNAGRFVNGYPTLGIYMLPLFIALPWGIFGNREARPIAWFLVGMLLWIEFGSMSWTSYLPFHKEPRYFSIISVPFAVLVALFLSRVWVIRVLLAKVIVIISVLLIAIFSFRTVKSEHKEYTTGRDFIPGLVQWLQHDPKVRLWTTGSFQNELDLRFSYRFNDLIHQHKGIDNYGSIMDLGFWNQRSVGDYVVIHNDWQEFSKIFPNVYPSQLKLIKELKGVSSTANLYQVKPELDIKTIQDKIFLSDLEPIRVAQMVGNMHQDRNFDGTSIVLNGVTYNKGLGTHANSEIVYDLKGLFLEFSAHIGLDDAEVKSPGSIVFEVYTDKVLRFKSPVMRWDSETIHVMLDVKKVKELSLVVKDAGDGNMCDHANWADAILVK